LTKLTTRDEIVAYLDNYLRVAEIPDSSPNGLQVQGRDHVASIAYAVDASVQTIEAAAKAKADMLVVHHGLWWGRHEQIVGNMHARISALVHNDISLYAAHLPLDCHPEVGNNVELARLLGLEVECGFGEYKGVEIGVIATAPAPVPRAEFTDKLQAAVRTTPEALAFGPGKVSRVAIISGGGAMQAEAARQAGCDTLVTGETSHSAYHHARECGINLIYGGHYATETVGLKALDRHLRKRFPVGGRFLPAPTGY
jgi:dinuclear metal center YbgI/SA1388 family protein